jgi:hypothetical protein
VLLSLLETGLAGLHHAPPTHLDTSEECLPSQGLSAVCCSVGGLSNHGCSPLHSRVHVYKSVAPTVVESRWAGACIDPAAPSLCSHCGLG